MAGAEFEALRKRRGAASEEKEGERRERRRARRGPSDRARADQRAVLLSQLKLSRTLSCRRRRHRSSALHTEEDERSRGRGEGRGGKASPPRGSSAVLDGAARLRRLLRLVLPDALLLLLLEPLGVLLGGREEAGERQAVDRVGAELERAVGARRVGEERGDGAVCAHQQQKGLALRRCERCTTQARRRATHCPSPPPAPSRPVPLPHHPPPPPHRRPRPRPRRPSHPQRATARAARPATGPSRRSAGPRSWRRRARGGGSSARGR